MPYYILKTGMPMYDLERAYGLGLLIYTLTNEETKLFDKGHYYEIGNSISDYSIIKEKIPEVLSLVAENIESWDYILMTTNKPKARQEKKYKASLFLKKHCEDILKYYSSISQSVRKNKEPLTAPLELASIKGFREEIKCRRYDEGKDYKVPSDDWLLTIVGALHSVTWHYIPKNKENVAIIPSPDGEKGVDVSHLRDIKSFLTVEKLNRICTLGTVAHASVKLYQELWQRRQDPFPWMDSFNNFLYGSLVKTAFKPKPKTGGYFSLELFEKLLESENGDVILDYFDHIFKIGNFHGQEALSINFAEFLTKPTLESYSKFMHIYLKTIIKEEQRIKRPDDIIWQEIIKYVKD